MDSELLSEIDAGSGREGMVLPVVHPSMFRAYADLESMSLRRRSWLFKKVAVSLARGVLAKAFHANHASSR